MKWHTGSMVGLGFLLVVGLALEVFLEDAGFMRGLIRIGSLFVIVVFLVRSFSVKDDSDD